MLTLPFSRLSLLYFEWIEFSFPGSGIHKHITRAYTINLFITDPGTSTNVMTNLLALKFIYIHIFFFHEVAVTSTQNL